VKGISVTTTYFCHSVARANTTEMSHLILISMAFHRGHAIHAKVLQAAKHTETCPYYMITITIQDGRKMIGRAVKREQLDRLRVVRRGTSAPWLMQLEDEVLVPFGGTSALLPETDWLTGIRIIRRTKSASRDSSHHL